MSRTAGSNELEKKKQIEFGDFQTPYELAAQICGRLLKMGVRPDAVIEPTCGAGSFALAAASAFPAAREIYGFDVNKSHIDALRLKLSGHPDAAKIRLETADFFDADWRSIIGAMRGNLLVLGNFPWVTNSAMGSLGGKNLPKKSSFLKLKGFEAISGKANFDISEWMLLEALGWLSGRGGVVAMLVKTSVARKTLSHAQRLGIPVARASIAGIDAKKHFGVDVDAGLLVIRVDPQAAASDDYEIFNDLDDFQGRMVGRRFGMAIADLDLFSRHAFLYGESLQKWRSGVKHDAARVMEFTRREGGCENGLGEIVDLEPTYLFPLLKGSDIGGGKGWRERFVLATQRFVGEDTAPIKERAPKTWEYLQRHGALLDSRRSAIYKRNPRFSIFGVGEYTFKPWHIAICALYKRLGFRLVPPIEGRPVLFDDTVCFLSFDSESDARRTFGALSSQTAADFLSSMIFWDEKRPIKTGILNAFDWTRLIGADDAEAFKRPGARRKQRG